jgi:hypothetical protein
MSEPPTQAGPGPSDGECGSWGEVGAEEVLEAAIDCI